MVYENKGQFGAGFEDSFHVVERVVDGDTIVLDDKTSVRLLLIDAPELDQCFGPEAKEALQKLVLGQTVRLRMESGRVVSGLVLDARTVRLDL